MSTWATIHFQCDKCGAAGPEIVGPVDEASDRAGFLPDKWVEVHFQVFPRSTARGNTDESDKFADICPDCYKAMTKGMRVRHYMDTELPKKTRLPNLGGKT